MEIWAEVAKDVLKQYGLIGVFLVFAIYIVNKMLDYFMKRDTKKDELLSQKDERFVKLSNDVSEVVKTNTAALFKFSDSSNALLKELEDRKVGRLR